MLKIKKFTVNPFDENTYLVYDDGSGDAFVIDPGFTSAAERSLFDNFVSANGLNVKQIINTHMHLDHCFGIDYIAERYGAKVAAHGADAPLAAKFDEQCRRFGIIVGDEHRSIAINTPLADGDKVCVGGETFDVIHIPGHSPGGIGLYSAAAGVLFSGDSVFRSSIGRTDLEGGDYATLIRSVRKVLTMLPAHTVIYPGHGPATTAGDELRYNPYLRAE